MATLLLYYVHEEQFGIQHPLFSFIQSTTTLKHEEISSYSGEKASINAFLDAIHQNHSIHTVLTVQHMQFKS